MKRQNLIIRLLRKEFDATEQENESRELIEATISVKNRECPEVCEMVSDFEFEFKSKY